MRLIDADKLIDKLGVSDEDILFKEIIDNEPTVDAKIIKHGRWKTQGEVKQLTNNWLIYFKRGITTF